MLDNFFWNRGKKVAIVSFEGFELFFEELIRRAVIVVGGQHEALDIFIDVFESFAEGGLIGGELLFFLFHFFLDFDDLMVLLLNFMFVLKVVFLQKLYFFV